MIKICEKLLKNGPKQGTQTLSVFSLIMKKILLKIVKSTVKINCQNDQNWSKLVKDYSEIGQRKFQKLCPFGL